MSLYGRLFGFIAVFLFLVGGVSAITFVINDGDASVSLAATPDEEVAFSFVAADDPEKYSATLSADDSSGASVTQESDIEGADHVFSATAAISPDGDSAGTFAEVHDGNIVTSQDANTNKENSASVGQETSVNVNNGMASFGTDVHNLDNIMTTGIDIIGTGNLSTIQTGIISTKIEADYSFIGVSQLSNLTLKTGIAHTNTSEPYEQSETPFYVSSIWFNQTLMDEMEFGTYHSVNRTIVGINLDEYGQFESQATLNDATYKNWVKINVEEPLANKKQGVEMKTTIHAIGQMTATTNIHIKLPS